MNKKKRGKVSKKLPSLASVLANLRARVNGVAWQLVANGDVDGQGTELRRVVKALDRIVNQLARVRKEGRP